MTASNKSSTQNSAINTAQAACRPQDSVKSSDSSSLPTLDETWLAMMMRNMKRMAEDDNYRREIARQLS